MTTTEAVEAPKLEEDFAENQLLGVSASVRSSEHASERSSERADLPILGMYCLGMHCAACAARVEKALLKTEGVKSANVNFSTARATVHYDAQATNLEKLRDVVKQTGYEAMVLPTPSLTLKLKPLL